MNRRESMTIDIKNTNDPQKKYRLGTVSKMKTYFDLFLSGRLKQVLLQICFCFVMRENLCCLCLTIIKLIL